MGINSIALLKRTVKVAPDVMGKLRDLLDREVDRHNREWMETMQRLTVTEKTEKRPVFIRVRDVERDCRSIVNQLVTSIPKDVLLRTSFTERGKPTPVQVTEEVRVKSKSSFTFHGCKRRVRSELRFFFRGRDTVRGVRHLRARAGRLVRGEVDETTKG